jgi:hypothetical protein
LRARALIVAAAICAALLLPAGAQGAFGIESLSVTAREADETPTAQAGGHPYAFSAAVDLNASGAESDGDLRALTIHLPPGLLINPTVVSDCPAAAFHTPRVSPFEASASGESCPNASQVGVLEAKVGSTTRYFGLFALSAPFGSALSLGAAPFGTPLTFTGKVREGDAGFDLSLAEVPQSLDLQRLGIEIWGTPWIPKAKPGEKPGEPPPPNPHDDQRGNCLNEQTGATWGDCLLSASGRASESLIHSYLTMPTTPCGAPLPYSADATSWQGDGAFAQATTPALGGCSKALTIVKVALMNDQAAARTGLLFNLAVNDGGGILNSAGIARPAIKTAIASLPEGLTINPSLGAGLSTCTEAQWASETATSAEGAGCPNASKIGTVEVQGEIGLSEPMQGALYIATPYQNPSHSLIGLYLIAKNQRRGLIAKSLGRLEPDPTTGKLIATFEDLPRLLYTHLTIALREGQRSTLVSPPTCGPYKSGLEIASWAQPALFSPDSSFFTINSGGGPCPPGGVAPFAPGLSAGSLNASPAKHTPLYIRMTREDSEEEITDYSSSFPPGLLGSIAGVPYCPEAAIAAATSHTGLAEKEAPSCPAAAKIGHTMAGFGVGGTLAWAPGNLYLAGPYHGAPLSVVAIDSALIGPFDLGVVVVREAVRVNTQSAQVYLDAQGSDPIPHILAGIPLHLRDIRVYVDRPNFMLTPTSCDPMSISSTLQGAGQDLFSSADDPTASAQGRYQLLGCQALGFKPRLSFAFEGKVRRGRASVLKATYKPRPGDANVKSVSVSLPATIFLEQSHIGTVCTRPQFRADNCPADSVYGKATAYTPLTDEPFTGPVYLRASDSTLPDLVARIAARGISIDLVGHIDSTKRPRRIRATFSGLPDAPVSKFVMAMNGGKHGILVPSGGFCASARKASVRFIAQSNETAITHPAVAAKCAGAKAKAKDGDER